MMPYTRFHLETSCSCFICWFMEQLQEMFWFIMLDKDSQKGISSLTTKKKLFLFATLSSVVHMWSLSTVVSQLWQIAVPTAGSRHVLYQSVGSEEHSLPRGFLCEMFHNRSRNKHVQTQAAVLFMANWLDYSQPMFGGRRATSHYFRASFFFFLFFVLVLTFTAFTWMIGMMCHCRLGHG